jgi:hypothetical protein
VKLWLHKEGITTNFFSPLSFNAVFVSWIRDLGSRMGKIRIRDLGSGINILDSANCTELMMIILTRAER